MFCMKCVKMNNNNIFETVDCKISDLKNILSYFDMNANGRPSELNCNSEQQVPSNSWQRFNSTSFNNNAFVSNSHSFKFNENIYTNNPQHQQQDESALFSRRRSTNNSNSYNFNNHQTNNSTTRNFQNDWNIRNPKEVPTNSEYNHKNQITPNLFDIERSSRSSSTECDIKSYLKEFIELEPEETVRSSRNTDQKLEEELDHLETIRNEKERSSDVDDAITLSDLDNDSDATVIYEEEQPEIKMEKSQLSVHALASNEMVGNSKVMNWMKSCEATTADNEFITLSSEDQDDFSSPKHKSISDDDSNSPPSSAKKRKITSDDETNQRASITKIRSESGSDSEETTYKPKKIRFEPEKKRIAPRIENLREKTPPKIVTTGKRTIHLNLKTNSKTVATRQSKTKKKPNPKLAHTLNYTKAMQAQIKKESQTRIKLNEEKKMESSKTTNKENSLPLNSSNSGSSTSNDKSTKEVQRKDSTSSIPKRTETKNLESDDVASTNSMENVEKEMSSSLKKNESGKKNKDRRKSRDALFEVPDIPRTKAETSKSTRLIDPLKTDSTSKSSSSSSKKHEHSSSKRHDKSKSSDHHRRSSSSSSKSHRDRRRRSSSDRDRHDKEKHHSSEKHRRKDGGSERDKHDRSKEREKVHGDRSNVENVMIDKPICESDSISCPPSSPPNEPTLPAISESQHPPLPPQTEPELEQPPQPVTSGYIMNDYIPDNFENCPPSPGAETVIFSENLEEDQEPEFERKPTSSELVRKIEPQFDDYEMEVPNVASEMKPTKRELASYAIDECEKQLSEIQNDLTTTEEQTTTEMDDSNTKDHKPEFLNDDDLLNILGSSQTNSQSVGEVVVEVAIDDETGDSSINSSDIVSNGIQVLSNEMIRPPTQTINSQYGSEGGGSCDINEVEPTSMGTVVIVSNEMETEEVDSSSQATVTSETEINDEGSQVCQETDTEDNNNEVIEIDDDDEEKNKAEEIVEENVKQLDETSSSQITVDNTSSVIVSLKDVIMPEHNIPTNTENEIEVRTTEEGVEENLSSEQKEVVRSPSVNDNIEDRPASNETERVVSDETTTECGGIRVRDPVAMGIEEVGNFTTTESPNETNPYRESAIQFLERHEIDKVVDTLLLSCRHNEIFKNGIELCKYLTCESSKKFYTELNSAQFYQFNSQLVNRNYENLVPIVKRYTELDELVQFYIVDQVYERLENACRAAKVAVIERNIRWVENLFVATRERYIDTNKLTPPQQLMHIAQNGKFVPPEHAVIPITQTAHHVVNPPPSTLRQHLQPPQQQQQQQQQPMTTQRTPTQTLRLIRPLQQQDPATIRNNEISPQIPEMRDEVPYRNYHRQMSQYQHHQQNYQQQQLALQQKHVHNVKKVVVRPQEPINCSAPSSYPHSSRPPHDSKHSKQIYGPPSDHKLSPHIVNPPNLVLHPGYGQQMSSPSTSVKSPPVFSQMNRSNQPDGGEYIQHRAAHQTQSTSLPSHTGPPVSKPTNVALNQMLYNRREQHYDNQISPQPQQPQQHPKDSIPHATTNSLLKQQLNARSHPTPPRPIASHPMPSANQQQGTPPAIDHRYLVPTNIPTSVTMSHLHQPQSHHQQSPAGYGGGMQQHVPIPHRDTIVHHHPQNVVHQRPQSIVPPSQPANYPHHQQQQLERPNEILQHIQQRSNPGMEQIQPLNHLQQMAVRPHSGQTLIHHQEMRQPHIDNNLVLYKGLQPHPQAIQHRPLIPVVYPTPRNTNNQTNNNTVVQHAYVRQMSNNSKPNSPTEHQVQHHQQQQQQQLQQPHQLLQQQSSSTPVCVFEVVTNQEDGYHVRMVSSGNTTVPIQTTTKTIAKAQSTSLQTNVCTNSVSSVATSEVVSTSCTDQPRTSPDSQTQPNVILHDPYLNTFIQNKIKEEFEQYVRNQTNGIPNAISQPTSEQSTNMRHLNQSEKKQFHCTICGIAGEMFCTNCNCACYCSDKCKDSDKEHKNNCK